jgi:phage shock protein E
MDQETFIDVRTDKEWAEGHLDGALRFDLALLLHGQLPDIKKDAQIALYCRAGRRAGLALQILQEHGFTSARNAGGFDDLIRQRKENE